MMEEIPHFVLTRFKTLKRGEKPTVFSYRRNRSEPHIRFRKLIESRTSEKEGPRIGGKVGSKDQHSFTRVRAVQMRQIQHHA